MQSYCRRWTLALATLSVGGCAAGAIDRTGSHAQPYLLSENALSLNGAISNGLLLNGLTMNGVRMNGVRMNGVAFADLSLNGLSRDESIWIMGYVVSCALAADHSITFTVADQPYTLVGGLGLAPNLEYGPLSSLNDQELVSACLMARVNWLSSFGSPHTVSISIRGNQPNLTSPDAGYNFYDSGFFGNLFEAPAQMYVCIIENTGLFASDYVDIYGRGRAIGYFNGALEFLGFQYGSVPDGSVTAQNCFGADNGASHACDSFYDADFTVPPDSDYDQAILSTCNGWGRRWTHPVFTSLDSLTDSP
jgi:hypothetical protein